MVYIRYDNRVFKEENSFLRRNSHFFLFFLLFSQASKAFGIQGHTGFSLIRDHYNDKET